LVIGLLIFGAGCSNTIALQRPVTAVDREMVTRAVGGREVRVTAATSTSAREADAGLRGTARLPSDSGEIMVLRMPAEELESQLPLERTRSIAFTNRGKGAVEGALIGFIPGFIAGLLMGTASQGINCSSCDGNPCPPSAGCDSSAGPLMLGLSVGAFSALIGAGIGAIIGHRTTFTF